MNGIWNISNNQSTQTHTGAITQSLKPQRDKDLKIEDLISGSANQTQTLLHYTEYALKNGNIEIFWKLNHNIRN